VVTVDSRLTVGLIGYGYWGPNLLRNYMELPVVDVRWVCDRNPVQLAKVGLRYPGLQVTGNIDDLFGDPGLDAVLIATPISTHFPLAKRALLAGKHVFVEKPLAASSIEAAALTRLAEELGLTLMVGHTFEYSPPVTHIKDIIDSGDLGEVHFITSTRVNLGLHQHDVSVIWDLAPHDFSILFNWLDEEPVQVSAVGRGCVREDIPDVAFVTLRFPSGVVAECQLSWLSPVKLRRTMVVGSKKMLLYDDTEPAEKIKIFDHGVNMVEPSSFGEYQLSYRTGDIVSPRVEPGEPLHLEAVHFIESIRSGNPPKTDARNGLRVVRALERAQASLDTQSRNRRWDDSASSDAPAAGQPRVGDGSGSAVGGTS
jgi:predicted dehydrogenase